MNRLILLASLLTVSASAAPIERVWLTHTSDTPSHIVVNWMSDTPGNSTVEYGETEALGETISVEENVTLHHVEIPIPTRGAQYHYRVRSGDEVSDRFSFKGYPLDELRIAVVGNWGGAMNRELLSLIQDDVHLLLTAGDNVPSLHRSGAEGILAFATLIDHYPALFRSTPFMPVLGNHDRELTPRGPEPPAHDVYDVEATAYRDFFALPGDGWKWTFDLPEFDLRLFALDASHLSDQHNTWKTCHPFSGDSAQHKWYAKEITDLDRDFVVTVYNERNQTVRSYDKAAWRPQLEQSSLCITGFGHFSERAEEYGIPWFNTSLKGTGTLYPDRASAFVAQEDAYLLLTLVKQAPSMKVEIKGLNGTVLDTREIPKRSR